ncbi:uncharacterized protein [Panulirus ornatus]|uniref:uncharacterized protein n=1 Tax=Panulirus ornatus TaxID=150431 RepID=UPI003A85B519
MIMRGPLTASLLAYVLIVLTVCDPEVSSILPFRTSRTRKVQRPQGLRKTRSTMREEQDRAFWPARTWGIPRTLLLQKDEDVVDIDVETKSNLVESSETCGSGCDPEGSLKLTRELLPELLQEVVHYTRVTQMVILTYSNSQGLCVAVARSLYLRGLPTSCARSTTIAGSHPAIVLLTHQETLESFPNTSGEFCVDLPQGDAVDVREVFTFGPGSTGRPTEDVVGTWRPGVPSHLSDRSTAVVPKDFQGNTLIFAVTQVAPYVILKKRANGTLRPSGYLVDLVHILQQQLNFTSVHIYDTS